MSEVKTYDPEQVSVILGGDIASGFGEGDAIKVTPNADRVSMKVGMKGHVTRTKSSDRTGLLTLVLQQTSETNAKLQAYLNILDAGGDDTFPALVKDNNGNDIHASEIAWVMKQPEVNYGAESGEVTWEIALGRLRGQILGHS